MKNILVSLAALLCLPAAFAAEGTFPVEDGFLSVGLDQLNVVREEEGGIDLIYKPEGVFERLAKYDKIMIDQPTPAPSTTTSAPWPLAVRPSARSTRRSVP